jgi:hypothetical protein
MRLIGIFVVGLTLSTCVSHEAVYQRSLAAPHMDVPQSDFEQIAKILSHHTRRPIASIEARSDDMVLVHAAFPNEERLGVGSDFAFVKRDGRWHMLTQLQAP